MRSLPPEIQHTGLGPAQSTGRRMRRTLRSVKAGDGGSQLKVPNLLLDALILTVGRGGEGG